MTDIDTDLLQKFQKRFTAMKSARLSYEIIRQQIDKQVQAKTEISNEGRFLLNLPIEQDIIELSQGRYAGKLNFNIEPNGKANVDELIPAKYILQDFMERENFHEKKIQARLSKAIYGTGVFYTGIKLKKTISYEPKEDEEIDDMYDTKNFTKTENEEYSFLGNHVPIYNFWVDDRAISHPNFHEYVTDCVMVEYMSKDEIIERRGKNKSFMNLESLNEGLLQPNTQGQNHASSIAITGQVAVYYYFDIQTKDFLIITNENNLIHKGRLISKSNRLPFEVGQLFPVHNSIYGRGIPEKIKGAKLYKTYMLQMALDKTTMSAGINVMIGGDEDVDGQRMTRPGEINVMRLSGGLDNVKPLVFDSNINNFEKMAQIMDDEIIQHSGENVKASFQSPSDTLGIVEIVEENKMVRTKCVDESDDIFFDNILTAGLNNITQFAPSLIKTTEKDKNGKKIKNIYPTIKVPGAKIRQKGKTITVEENMGEYGYFEFTKDMITSPLRVKIVTASTGNGLKKLEKDAMTQYISTIMQISQANPEMIQKVDWEGTMKLTQQIFGYDDKMMSDTQRDRNKKEQLATDEEIKNMLTPPEDVLPSIQPNDQQTQTLPAPMDTNAGSGIYG